MQTDGNEVACLALTNFVRMAITLSTGLNNNPVVGIPHPIPAPRNVNLLTNSSKLIHHYSSILNVGPTAAAIDLTPVLNHLNQRHTTKEARFIQAAAAKASKEESAVQEWLGDEFSSPSSGSQVSPTRLG